MLCVSSPSEHEALRLWMQQSFEESRLPCSFRYGDKLSSELLPSWQKTEEKTGSEDKKVLVFVDPATGLRLRCEIRIFKDAAAVEWILHFENAGQEPTPILSDVFPLDTSIPASRDRACRLHHARGSDCSLEDFEPLTTPLGPSSLAPQGPWIGAGNPVSIQSRGGRSSNGALPFFNLEVANAPGVIGAIGWTGDWAARFWRGDAGEVHMQAGMQRTHLKLFPGESIRSPRILVLFWEGDMVNGHNVWRQLLLDHYVPQRKPGDKKAPISFAMWGENRAERQLGKIKWFVDNDIRIDNFWIDAGWHGDNAYKDNSNVFNSNWGGQVGNWWPNKTSYPDGLSPIGKAAAKADMDFTIWIEAERVFKGTAFTRDHPSWLLGPLGDNSLFNLGNPEAREGLTQMVSDLIEEGGVTVYRQDFNMDPAPYWNATDTPDRVGINEIRHIEGLYAFWDALREKHPDLLIDNCSSGGRRIDIETLSRSIPLWRSDFQCFKDYDPIGMQGQTQGLCPWVPLHTGCCDRPDDVVFRSALGPGIVFAAPPNETGDPEGYLTPWQAYDAAWLKKAVEEQIKVQPYFAGNFYPLLSYSLDRDAWAAWQFDRPDLGEGMIQAFRRPASPIEEVAAVLKGLDPNATYELTDQDSSEKQTKRGDVLMAEGVSLRIQNKPGTKLVVYRRTPL